MEAPTHRVVHAPVTLNAEAEPIEVPAGQPWKATVGALHASSLSDLKLVTPSPPSQ